MPSSTKPELRIFTPTGMLGYGYNHDLFWSAIDEGVDAVICDSGSTDSGPSKLALGTMSCPREAYVRDLEPMITSASLYKIPVLIGSAGGDGSNAHVDVFVDIVKDIIQEKKLRSMKVITLYAEIDKKVIKEQLSAGNIKPCGASVPPLKSEDVDDASLVVAQMGLEPFLEAMNEHPDFDIIIAGRAYDPSPYAAFCLHHGFEDLGIAYHMGKILECGAICAVPKSREALAIVRRDHFDVMPTNPNARCTTVSVAAHTLYEKTRPDILIGPGGTLNLQGTTYEQLKDQRTVRVSGTSFIPVPDGQYTIKLEAARTAGYHSAFFGGFADPILISQLDHFVHNVRKQVGEMCTFAHELKLTTYGAADNISMFGKKNYPQGQLAATAAIAGEAKAATQQEANQVINAARVACMHSSYPNQVATSGNFGMVCAPFDIPMGQLCEFCIYHLMPVADAVEIFPRHLIEVEGLGEPAKGRPTLPHKAVPEAKSEVIPSQRQENTEQQSVLSPRLRPGLQYLGDLAAVIRSKNAGPFELTFDIMFDSPSNYSIVKKSGALSASIVADVYGIDESDVVAALWWDPALAFKITVKRPIISGSFGETDTHGSCQHVRLMYLQVEVDV